MIENAIRSTLLLCGFASFVCISPRVYAAERWGVAELTLRSSDAPRTMDISVTATFRHGDRSVTVPGFWDGEDLFTVRFSPPAEGEWEYLTASRFKSLDGIKGAVMVQSPSRDNHGPIEVFDAFYLRYADGTPYHQFGTTCYAWVHQTQELQEQTLKTLAASPFNKIRFCVFPKHYVYNSNEPERFAFQRKADGGFDFERPDPEFWQQFENRILDLQELGIEADIILWHPYDRWGFKTMSDTADDRYLRYCIARLSAYRNVWWSLANEYDFMSDLDGRHRGVKTMDDWDRFFDILAKEDPHQRLRGIHNGAIWYDHTKAWVTHASLQTSDMNGGVRFREQYQKPVIFDECKYEGNVPQGWGNLTGREMTQRFWLGTMSGCYVGHGETYLNDEEVLWWSKGGRLQGESPRRIEWLKNFLAHAPPFHELQPLGDDRGQFQLGIPGRYHLVYCLAGQTSVIKLPKGEPWKVDVIDPWTMTEWPEGTANPGEFTATALTEDRVFRFTRYAKGERLRPTAQPTASVTEGTPPLRVAFQSSSPHQVLWDFGDGSTSSEAAPSYTFHRPGIYHVSLTVTDEHGSVARGHIPVLVDQEVTEPLLRAGFGNEEDSPAFTLHGTAKRIPGGSFRMPSGEPWGRVESDDEASEMLAGLRSFTIRGWLKPTELAVGSGGNRILFTLRDSVTGIDLVHHADGRLRLSVNEWPDSIHNDSSPGQLVIDKWTYFTVTYDATKHGDNVVWYFSDPLDRPVDEPALRLDRRNSYNVGSVANRTGPIAVGNFNSTMKGYGYDRQFRGEIRQLEVYGSRISGRGAIAPAGTEN